jgi:4-amino-4-deoxy-L-arabinose transferase-like glycosyltransferase
MLNLKNIKFDIYFLLLLAIIVIFIIIKIPYLSLPFYWDEAWVYGPALRLMEANKLSLLPDALPIYYSRGHPLLFHFMGALWLRIFGTSLIASHTYALTISIALIISVYYFCKKLFSKEVGLIACIFLLVQPIFQAQSVFVLPEVMVSLFSLLAIYFFIQQRWLAYIAMATLLLYTKETGIVAIAACGTWFLIETFYIRRKEFQWKKFIINSCYLILPLMFIALYFLLQRKMNGWYFFPEHVNYLLHDTRTFSGKIESYFTYLFIYWGRNVLTASIIVSLFIYFFKKKYLHNPANKPLIILSLFILYYLIASSFNFYSDRYTMSMIAPFVIITAYLIRTTFRKIFLYGFVVAVIAVQLFIHLPKKTSSDHNLGYAESIKTHQEMIAYCLQNHFTNKKIFTHFLMFENLRNPYCGYISDDEKFSNATTVFTDSTDLCIFSNMEGKEDYEALKKTGKIKLLKRFESCQAWSEIYEVKK